MQVDYREFIRSKVRIARPLGFDAESVEINSNLFDWQASIVRWCLKRGRAALFADTGLGKTLMQLEWARHVWDAEHEPIIIHSPVGVRHQTKREAEKFGIACPIAVVDEDSDCINGINLVNYEKLHKFNPSRFVAVVLDESSILKNFTGKIKRQLIDSYARSKYRLACTATPAPNDHMELGNHADFLGVMPSNEMLSRWFINDTMKAGGYRLKGHAERDFWRWLSTWAMCISKPSDIGGCDDGYDLPPLHIKRHVVSVDFTPSAEGLLFDVHGINATNLHEEKRRTNEARAKRVAELCSEVPAGESVLVWCDTNYEADELAKALPNSIGVRGSDKESDKESILKGFSDGSVKLLVTKPGIAGLGMNFQVCNHQIFNGIGFSFEKFYQAVRRSYRFGQKRPVHVDIVLSDAESAIEKTIARKETDHKLMQAGMRQAVSLSDNLELTRDRYETQLEMEIPKWLVK